MRKSSRDMLLAAATGVVVIVSLALPRISQDPAYHQFADRRPLLGIPNSLDVLSNLPFLLVGLLGLWTVYLASHFHDQRERLPYAVLFAGCLLTAFGSAYYHLEPNNARLVWDRLPMTIGFMGLLSAVLSERLGLSWGRRLLFPLLAGGAGSVAYWHWTEAAGAGDLRPYILIQFGSLVLILLLLLLYRAPYAGAGYWFAGLAAYTAAKILELADRPIFAIGQVVSGHTLKHLSAALGLALLVIMLQRRSRSFAGEADHALGSAPVR